MKRIALFLFAGLIAVAFASCKKEKKQEDIVAKMPVETNAKPSGPQKRPDSHWSQVVDWHGGKYTVRIDRAADSTLVTDGSGQQFFDNHATLQVIRADGSVLLDKTFRKADFVKVKSSEGDAERTFLGMVFDCVRNDRLVFGASIGDPNPDSEEFVPFSIEVSPTGEVAVKESSIGVDEEEEPMD